MERRTWAALGAVVWLATLVAGYAPGDPGEEIPGFTLRASITPAASAPGAYATTVLVVAPQGNRARYRARGQLARMNLPGEAVGETDALVGAVALDAGGRVIPDLSTTVVDPTALRGSSGSRDGYVLHRLLETYLHPNVELRPTGFPECEGSTPSCAIP